MVFHETSSQTYGKRMWLPSFQSSFSFDDNFWHYFTYYFGVISCKLIHFTVYSLIISIISLIIRIFVVMSNQNGPIRQRNCMNHFEKTPIPFLVWPYIIVSGDNANYAIVGIIGLRLMVA